MSREGGRGRAFYAIVLLGELLGWEGAGIGWGAFMGNPVRPKVPRTPQRALQDCSCPERFILQFLAQGSGFRGEIGKPKEQY